MLLPYKEECSTVAFDHIVINNIINCPSSVSAFCTIFFKLDVVVSKEGEWYAVHNTVYVINCLINYPSSCNKQRDGLTPQGKRVDLALFIIWLLCY